ncbi:hypothetical protein EDC94DRAFT_414843 [Helicostylum pulchrum]|nr:hypothetical protein EDC94DRAFT_414843 [Helicostylum pulchrum]
MDSWLSTLYKEQEIPQFERTNKNYEILNNLKKLNFNSTKLVENYIINNTAVLCDTSFVAESNRNALDSLGSIGQVLGISQTELSNYYTAITKVSMNKMHKQIEDDKLNETDYALNQWQHEMTDELINMKAILSKLQSRRRDDNKSEQMINPNKSQYLILENKYNDLNIQTTISHLKHLDLKSNAMESDLLTKSNILTTSYLDLPTDIALASIKIQETEDELHELEAKREYLLSDMADLN